MTIDDVIQECESEIRYYEGKLLLLKAERAKQLMWWVTDSKKQERENGK
jgi:predicted DNA-binding protein YlxM (UPF0122 family)